MAITNNLENGKMKNYLIWPRNTTLLCPIIICIFILRNWINFNLAWNLFELPKNAELFHGYFIKNFAKIFLNTPGLFRLKCFFFNPYTPIPKVFWCIQRVEKGDIGMKWVLRDEQSIAWKVSVFWIFVVRIFPHSDWIGRDTHSVRMRENMDQKNSEYRHFTQWSGLNFLSKHELLSNLNAKPALNHRRGLSRSGLTRLRPYSRSGLVRLRSYLTVQSDKS